MNATELFTSDWVIQNCWAIHEGFRRLGFPADDIYLMPTDQIYVVLRQGEKEFIVNAGPYSDGPTAFVERWEVVRQGISDSRISDSLLFDTWEKSEIYEHAEAFYLGIASKGFDITGPKVTLP